MKPDNRLLAILRQGVDERSPGAQNRAPRRRQMRTLIALALMGLAPAAFAADEKAPTDKELDAAKAELDFHKDQMKAIDKIVKKWDKDADKEKWDKLPDLDADLKPYLRDQLGFVRDAGVETNAKDLPPAGVATVVTPDDKPKLEHVRDLALSLRDDPVDYGKGKEGVAVRRAKLDELKTEIDARYERKDAAYDAMKDAAK
jgi:hypothetical protein